MITYTTQGVCATQITFEVENGVVKNTLFTGGCPGNLRAIAQLIEGMPVDQVIKKLKGITCGNKATSCSDQLATALEQLKK